MGLSENPIPVEVMNHWSAFAGGRLLPVDAGLINETFVVRNDQGEKAVFQCLHPVFSPRVNEDIDAVTRHLASKGLATPMVLPTDDGALWVTDKDRTWRALSYVDGITHHFVIDAAMAGEAGRLVARFHAALADFADDYRSGRANVHDTAAHLDSLRTALQAHSAHRLYDSVAPMAADLLEQSADLIDLSGLPLRHAHGDLKISNLMFDAQGRGLCLIDLDTLTRMHWPLEMGDALRSWCNPRKEDQLPASLDLDLFGAAVSGYRRAVGGLIGNDEWEALVPGLMRICLELSARFLADALNERYFGWDASAYPARGEHNLARGRAMWALYRDVAEKRNQAEQWITKANVG